jgi:hypothetical protein
MDTNATKQRTETAKTFPPYAKVSAGGNAARGHQRTAPPEEFIRPVESQDMVGAKKVISSKKPTVGKHNTDTKKRERETNKSKVETCRRDTHISNGNKTSQDDVLTHENDSDNRSAHTECVSVTNPGVNASEDVRHRKKRRNKKLVNDAEEDEDIQFVAVPQPGIKAIPTQNKEATCTPHTSEEESVKGVARTGMKPKKDETTSTLVPLRPKSNTIMMRHDKGSLRSEGHPYPEHKLTSMENSDSLPQSLRDVFARYRKQHVVVAAFFGNPSCLRSALSAVPVGEGTQSALVSFSHPDVKGFATQEAVPALIQDKLVTPLRDLPNINIVINSGAGLQAATFIQAPADHVFIADHFIRRETCSVSLEQLQDVLERAPVDRALLIYRVVGDKYLRLQMCAVSGEDRSPTDVTIPTRDLDEADRAMEQYPILADTFSEWAYLQLNPGFLESALATTRRRGAGSKQSQKKGNMDDVDENVGDANRLVLFRIFAQNNESALLVVQIAEPPPSVTPEVMIIRKMVPLRGTSIWSNLECGMRLAMTMVGGFGHSSGGVDMSLEGLLAGDGDDGDDDGEKGNGNVLAGYTQLAFCAMNVGRARDVFCATPTSIQTARPILLLPHVYDPTLDSKKPLEDHGGLIAFAQGLPREAAPRTFTIVRSSTTLDCTGDVMEQFPVPSSAISVVGHFNPADMVDPSFSRLGSN